MELLKTILKFFLISSAIVVVVGYHETAGLVPRSGIKRLVPSGPNPAQSPDSPPVAYRSAVSKVRIPETPEAIRKLQTTSEGQIPETPEASTIGTTSVVRIPETPEAIRKIRTTSEIRIPETPEVSKIGTTSEVRIPETTEAKA